MTIAKVQVFTSSLSIPLCIALLVKLIEEEEKHDGMHADPPYKSFGIIAVDEEELECVYHDCNELEHLKCGQVFFPPEVWLNSRPKCSQ
jgi:hypothetical protein